MAQQRWCEACDNFSDFEERQYPEGSLFACLECGEEYEREEFETVLDLWLPALNVRSPAVGVTVILSAIGIHRVELTEATTFFSPDHNTAITLPKRLNVLSEMDREGKVALKEEMEGRDHD